MGVPMRLKAEVTFLSGGKMMIRLPFLHDPESETLQDWLKSLGSHEHVVVQGAPHGCLHIHIDCGENYSFRTGRDRGEG
jgi:hypothetical protein